MVPFNLFLDNLAGIQYFKMEVENPLGALRQILEYDNIISCLRETRHNELVIFKEPSSQVVNQNKLIFQMSNEVIKDQFTNTNTRIHEECE